MAENSSTAPGMASNNTYTAGASNDTFTTTVGGVTSTYTHDAASNVTQRTDANGKTPLQTFVDSVPLAKEKMLAA